MSVKGGRGVPLLSDKKNPFKMAQNQCFWAKNAVFGGKKSVFGNESSVMGGGGVPPFSVNFSEKSLPWRPRGRRGVPPQRKVSVPGVFEPFPNREHLNQLMYEINMPCSGVVKYQTFWNQLNVFQCSNVHPMLSNVFLCFPIFIQCFPLFSFVFLFSNVHHHHGGRHQKRSSSE